MLVSRRTLDFFQFLPDGPFHILKGVARGRLPDDVEESGIQAARDVGIDAGADAPFDDQPTDEAARFAVRQDVGQHVKGVIVRMQAVAHVETQIEGIDRDGTCHLQPSRFRLTGFLRQVAYGDLPCRNRSEPLFSQL